MTFTSELTNTQLVATEARLMKWIAAEEEDLIDARKVIEERFAKGHEVNNFEIDRLLRSQESAAIASQVKGILGHVANDLEYRIVAVERFVFDRVITTNELTNRNTSPIINRSNDFKRAHYIELAGILRGDF